MDDTKALFGFMEMIREDPRIGPSHISLYMAILYAYRQQDSRIPISVFSRDLMKQAKISGGATYHKCLQDLTQCGYIRYVPSYNPMLGSLVYLSNV
ncbi:hypothetical protein [Parafilimonas sp.]|uniref:hypothetical protein n=1 Tax=Parafilimonas sp. TaxID=1969739 RepID=UPI003F7F1EEE